LTGSKKRVSATPPTNPTAAPTPGRAQSITDNIADCALARPVDPTMFQSQIVNIGAIREIRPPSLGMSVIKTGRTTGTNTSSVTLLNATVSIAYNTSKGPRNARFSGQVICDPFSQGGDSGALVIDQSSNQAVGLLFAGSGLASIFTPISVVLDALNVTLED
jgi:hypothetical protein